MVSEVRWRFVLKACGTLGERRLCNGTGGHRDAGHGAGPCMLHNASYDFNDELLPIGSRYWVRLAHRFLAQG
jgi:metal-dependent amidase/aminoacylase/carboxypeptidase family protein